MKKLVFALMLLPVFACGGADDVDMTSDELAGNPQSIDIGFNGGSEQFAYMDDFIQAQGGPKGPRICHTYPLWDVALQAPGHGALSDPTSRAWLESWLAHAEGHCDEALMTFKGTSGAPPSVAAYTNAMKAFLSTSWKGWTGKFAFTAWNEPNNGAGSGDGLGTKLSPDRAAEYYLALRHLCGKSCKVAAGDMASNGGMIDDFQWNCPNDNVAPNALCSKASWLDRYKNYIANHANDAPYHLGKGFRPEYFAFHPWYDVNGYLYSKEHCQDEAHCSTRALLKNLGGSWGGVKLWDTEVGLAQDGKPAIDDARQACGAAFLVRLTANLSARVTRVYYTRLHGGNPSLYAGNTKRHAFDVLAKRETKYGGAACF